MKTDADAIVEATRVLEQLIKDCETVARNLETSRVTHNRLVRDMTGYRSALVSDDFSLKDLCGLIEGVHGNMVVAKKRIPRFDAHHPEIIKRLSKAEDLVLDVNGVFVGPTSIEIPLDLCLGAKHSLRDNG